MYNTIILFEAVLYPYNKYNTLFTPQDELRKKKKEIYSRLTKIIQVN